MRTQESPSAQDDLSDCQYWKWKCQRLWGAVELKSSLLFPSAVSTPMALFPSMSTLSTRTCVLTTRLLGLFLSIAAEVVRIPWAAEEGDAPNPISSPELRSRLALYWRLCQHIRRSPRFWLYSRQMLGLFP